MSLSSIFCDSRELKIGDKAIEIKQIQIGDLPKVLTIMEKIIGLVPEITGAKKSNEKMASLVLSAITKDFDSILSILGATTSLTDEEIRKLNVAATTLILTEVLKDNIDFLSQHALGAVKDLMKVIGSKRSKG